METITPPKKPVPMLPAELRERLRQAHSEVDGVPASRHGRLPVWVAAACLGAGLLAAPACGKKEKDPPPPPGLETALQMPAEMAMEPELESQDPMDPEPGQVEPPPGSMTPLPPPTRGADKPEDPLAGVPGGQPGSGDLRSGARIDNLGGRLYGAPAISRPMPTILEGGNAIFTGNIDPAEVRAVIRAHRNETHHCYQKALMKNPKLVGTVRLKFEIGKGGRVGSCSVVENLSDPSVAECLINRLKIWRFPIPEKGKVVVTYSWVFEFPK